jgi:hypothetical protein
VSAIFLLGVENLEAAVLTVFFVGLCIPVVLYVYGRHHAHDLVIAEFAHMVVRPVAVLYRLFQRP